MKPSQQTWDKNTALCHGTRSWAFDTGQSRTVGACDRKSMKRRDFLASLPIAVTMLRLPGRYNATADLQWLYSPGLLEILGGQRIQRLGALYRRMYPAENSPKRLKSLILRTIGYRPDGEAALAKAVCQEFAAERTVLVNGWVLSVTEARQCALYSLVAD